LEIATCSCREPVLPHYVKLGDIMEIYKNAIQTERAFIMFNKIQHISWDYESDYNILLKIYSSAGKIVQLISEEHFDSFMLRYKYFEGVKA
jgi:hypothetical protein